MSQIGSSPQVGMKIKNIWNHHLPRFHQTGSWFTSFRDHHSLATQLITFTEIQQNPASTKRPLPWFIHLPGTPHNHLLNGCLVISNHFLYKDLESSNWNNHKNWLFGVPGRNVGFSTLSSITGVFFPQKIEQKKWAFIFQFGHHHLHCDSIFHMLLGLGNQRLHQNHQLLLLMKEILHHLGCIKAYTYWDKQSTNHCSSTVDLILLNHVEPPKKNPASAGWQAKCDNKTSPLHWRD